MIICGFPGIGKTTVANQFEGFYDLDSSRWSKLGGSWAKKYVESAESISALGLNVFVSTHAAVLDEVEKMTTPEKKVLIFPKRELKEEWCERLETRWHRTKDEKDFRAWQAVENNWDNFIDGLENRTDFDEVIELKSTNYKLKKIIKKIRKNTCEDESE